MKAKIPQLFFAATALFVTDMATHAATVLVDDDFSGLNLLRNGRFRSFHIDTDRWVQRSNATNQPDWSVTGGQLTNPAVDQNDEMGAHRIDTVNTAHTAIEITVSFDYSVGAGSTLYYHSALYTGAYSDNLPRITQVNGAYYAGDFNNAFAGPEYNLKDGSTPVNGAGGAVASFAGGTSGTYTATFDIRGYGGGGFDMTDVSHILNVFTSNNNASGNAITIDNFLMTAAPEPSSTALLGLGLSSLLLRRRRS